MQGDFVIIIFMQSNTFNKSSSSDNIKIGCFVESQNLVAIFFSASYQ